MSVPEIEHPVVVSDCVTEPTIPTPFFARYGGSDRPHYPVRIVGSDEDVKSISSFPTLEGGIAWRVNGIDQPGEPDTWLTLVIWNPSFSHELPPSLRGSKGRYPFPTLIAYRSPDTPPQTLHGQPTSLLRFEGSVGNLVRRLVPSLIIPVTFLGLICVGEQDIEEAVNRGGTVMQFIRQSDDVQAALAAILRDIDTHLPTLGPEASVCLGILTNFASLDLKLVDDIAGDVTKMLHPNIFLVVSATAHSGSEACISVLTVAGDFHDQPNARAAS